MKLKHTTPCAECPWRKESAPGWLGGYPPELYADAVQENEVPACHLNDHGPDSAKTAMCAGALSVCANSAIIPSKTKGGKEARDIVGQRSDTFKWVRDFFAHHTHGKEYMTPLMRRLAGK